MRLAVGISLIANGIQKFQSGQALELALVNILAIGAGALLAVGLWTPVAGCLVAFITLCSAIAHHASWCPAAMGAGLALVGPGAWSLDAWLFGWKRIDIAD
jgi:putative oxidoreductase